MIDNVLRFVFSEVERRHGPNWLGSARGGSPGSPGVVAQLESFGLRLTTRQTERLSRTPDLSALLEGFGLRGVRLDSHLGLLGWLKGRYPLVLLNDIPSPDEMLRVQCEGRRFVTLLSAWDGQALGRHKDPFEFLLHDLEHAQKFFADPILHEGQVRFFRFLRTHMHFFSTWLDDGLFMKDLHYLMSDMNSHPLHMLKYLKAIVLTATLRQSGNNEADLNGFWKDVLSDWPTEPLMAVLRLNHPGLESEEDHRRLSAYLVT